ncbi:hypothetical protein [Aquibium oceanicum]|uniref:Uncharacterized protein n=1 Tax=Aquibium oceanicum TaxID=1670800 RepID=A0A1L3SXL0_9HYPH|nr:hypothetical protein [Aquibium oceanicum]APH74101.1 hypothetical protein BSQ44_24085 [Aquibium oceanicum]
MNKFVKAMDEWLTTQGLDQGEINMISELKKRAGQGEEPLRAIALFYRQVMPETVISAVNKARAQGKCKCYPD